jgi:nicotinamidase-related amidase
MRLVGNVPVREALAELVERSSTAILLVDVQNDFCHPQGHFGRHGRDLSQAAEALPRIVDFVARAQALEVPVVFIQQTTPADGSADSPAWLRFKTRDGKSPDYGTPGTWGWELVDGLKPGPADMRMNKPRPDAFIGTTLKDDLRARGIESLVILGTTTEGCVESTVRAASYHDFYVVVVSDGVCSCSRPLHDGSMRFYEARYPLATAQEILSVWESEKGSDLQTAAA